jgi:hypothetical protein
MTYKRLSAGEDGAPREEFRQVGCVLGLHLEEAWRDREVQIHGAYVDLDSF